jgi:hypothetical protein
MQSTPDDAVFYRFRRFNIARRDYWDPVCTRKKRWMSKDVELVI